MGTRGKRVLKFQAECKESQIERAIMVTRPGSLMLLLAAGIVGIAALGSGTKHDPLPGANGMVDFLQADAVVTENTQSSVNAVAISTCPFKNEDCCVETNTEARDTCLRSVCATLSGSIQLSFWHKVEKCVFALSTVVYLPSEAPTEAPTEALNEAPTEAQTEALTEAPTETPTIEPTDVGTTRPNAPPP